MSDSHDAKLVDKRRLKKGQAVPCDGRIYQDHYGQFWFGIPRLIKGPKDYRKWLTLVRTPEKERAQ